MTEWLRSDFEDDPVVESKPKSSATIANAAIRKEKQLQEEAAAALGVNSITDILPPAATISVDDALTSTNENISLNDIKIENDVDINIENVNVVDAMEQLVVTDNGTDSCDVQNENLLNQYDDINDLIDEI
jgi:hypothetical protein